jgi:prophage antirepressor-like protein
MVDNFIQEYFRNNIETFEINGKKWYKATDIACILKLTSIRALIQNYSEDEKMIRNTVKEAGNQQTIFINSSGLYRLLFNVKCELGVKFRKRVTGILDDLWLEVDEEIGEDDEENSEEDSLYDFLNDLE